MGPGEGMGTDSSCAPGWGRILRKAFIVDVGIVYRRKSQQPAKFAILAHASGEAKIEGARHVLPLQSRRLQRRAKPEGGKLSFSQRFEEIRTGFEPAFWVANFTEIFERVAYYGTTAVLAIYLKEQLHFSSELTGWLVGTFGLVVWFLPILGGTLADRFGFRRALMFAYLVMTVGYFLLGSLSAPWMESLRQSLGDKWLVLAILMIPALGPGVVKPCVAGTTARASNENVRSLGYSIYYTLVNIGGALGPIVAWLVRKQLGWGIENVFRVSAL